MASQLKAGGAYSRLSNGRGSALNSGGSPRCAIWMRWQKDCYGNFYDHYWRADFTGEGVIRFLEEAQRWKAWKAKKGTPEVTDTDGFGATDPQIAFFDQLELQKPNLGYMAEQLIHIEPGALDNRKDANRVVPFGYETLDFDFDRIESTVPITAAALRAQFEAVRNNRHITHVQLEIHWHLDAYVSPTVPGENLDLESFPEPAAQYQKALIGSVAWTDFVGQLRADYGHAVIEEASVVQSPVLAHSFINQAFLYFKQGVIFNNVTTPTVVSLGPDGLRPKTYLKIDGNFPTMNGYADVQIQELNDDDYTAVANVKSPAINAVNHALFYDNHRDITTAYDGGQTFLVKKPKWCRKGEQDGVSFVVSSYSIVGEDLFIDQEALDTRLHYQLQFQVNELVAAVYRTVYAKVTFNGHNRRLIETFVLDTGPPPPSMFPPVAFFSTLTQQAAWFQVLDVPYMPLQEQISIDLQGTEGIIERGIQNPVDYGILYIAPDYETILAGAGGIENLYLAYGSTTPLGGFVPNKTDTLYAPARNWKTISTIELISINQQHNLCYRVFPFALNCCDPAYDDWAEMASYCENYCNNPVAAIPPWPTILCP